MLSESERSTLLRIAWTTLEHHFGSRIPYAPMLSDELIAFRSVFVTLRNRGRLRGCRGVVQALVPLWQAIEEMTLSAALHDSRFKRVSADEIQDLSIEISVLSSFEQFRAADDLCIGTHGVMIRCGGRHGLLLPQVGSDMEWSAVELLRQVCIKAHLPPESWRRPDAVLERFTAEAFSSGPLGHAASRAEIPPHLARS